MNTFLSKENLVTELNRICKNIENDDSIVLVGVVTKITGMKIEATNLAVPLGTLCKILVNDVSSHAMSAEVIGFSKDMTYLMAIEYIDGITPGSAVVPVSRTRDAHVGHALLGRIIDGRGHPIDEKGELNCPEIQPLMPKPINPILRKRIVEPLNVGIRAINALLTVGKGQRLGIFAGSGVGKSVLLGMMTHFTSADVVVVGLIGERGREVKEFIEENLGEDGLAKSVIVAAAADTTPLMRVNGAILATTIAEYFRDKGLDVLLIVDSLTRYAQSQREISLSAGELPATKGFTPSVFAKVSQLVERSGTGAEGQGSITAFYTVLVEGDDHNDPIADHARSVLDGHIVLSRQLADSGHYPAIDVEKSISRVVNNIVDKPILELVNQFKRIYSAYQQNKDVINIGMYQSGSDRVIDEAIHYKDKMSDFLKQAIDESCDMENSLLQLMKIFSTKE